jgi:hypothetical protein
VKKAAAGEKDCSVPELERKYVFRDPEAAFALFDEKALRACYRLVFQHVLGDRGRFPDLARAFGRAARRAAEQKDLRARLYFTDGRFLLTDDHWEVRLDRMDSRLMIKQGNGADAAHPTLNRAETKINMLRPVIGSIADINTNSVGKKGAPKDLVRLFEYAREKLYPVVSTVSVRDKLIYFRPVSHAGRPLLIAFEFAQDEGEAKPLKSLPYAIDQLELEVKRVIDTRSGIDILRYPEQIGMTQEDIESAVIEPALNAEEEFLCETFGLMPVFDSKPKHGLAAARDIMSSAAGMKAASKARKEHMTRTVWQGISL